MASLALFSGTARQVRWPSRDGHGLPIREFGRDREILNLDGDTVHDRSTGDPFPVDGPRLEIRRDGTGMRDDTQPMLFPK
jgi:hypothetical protein